MSKTSSLLLRLALVFSFLYVAYGFWTNPNDWLGYIPAFVKNVGLPQDTLLLLLAAFHIVLALWLLSGWRIFIPSLVAAVFLGSVVYFNQNQLDILFRDISLALVALALALAFNSRH
ncbi:MAG: DoxX family membrane protein [Patescibacteria group bacterium]